MRARLFPDAIWPRQADIKGSEIKGPWRMITGLVPVAMMSLPSLFSWDVEDGEVYLLYVGSGKDDVRIDGHD